MNIFQKNSSTMLEVRAMAKKPRGGLTLAEAVTLPVFIPYRTEYGGDFGNEDIPLERMARDPEELVNILSVIPNCKPVQWAGIYSLMELGFSIDFHHVEIDCTKLRLHFCDFAYEDSEGERWEVVLNFNSKDRIWQYDFYQVRNQDEWGAVDFYLLD